MKKINFGAREMTFVAIFSSVIAIISQISIPMPSAVPLTIQLFAVALAGYFLNFREAALSVLIYVLLGVVGIPVFSGFKGGFYVLVGPTGGFIWGFIIVAILCSVFSYSVLAIPVGIFSVLVCHALGVVQYMILSNVGFWASAISVSLPYIVKDMVLVLLAYAVNLKIKKQIKI